MRTSPTSASSPSARHHASASAGANRPESKVNGIVLSWPVCLTRCCSSFRCPPAAEEEDERETDQLLRDAADDQGFFDVSDPPFILDFSGIDRDGGRFSLFVTTSASLRAERTRLVQRETRPPGARGQHFRIVPRTIECSSVDARSATGWSQRR